MTPPACCLDYHEHALLLACLTIAWAPLIHSSTLLYGRFILDNGRWNQKRRAQIGFLMWCVPMVACIAWMLGNQTVYRRMDKLPKYDWTDQGWANAYLPFVCLVSSPRSAAG